MTIPFLGQVVFWHWWALAVILLIIETLAPGAFFMWMGVSAGIVGALLAFFPGMGWQLQVFIFAVFSVATIVGWRSYLRRNPTETDEPLLNRRGSQYVGRTFELTEEMKLGRGKINVDDTSWRAVCDDETDLPAGSRVKVIAIDGTILKVEPA